MRNNQKILVSFLVLALTFFSSSVFSQGFKPEKGFKQVNFGLEFEGFGIPFYAGIDIGVSEFITIGPRVSVAFDDRSYGRPGFTQDASWTRILPSFRGDYHWSGHIEDLPEELDFYAGASLGVAFYRWSYEDSQGNDFSDTDSDVEFGVQVGARYYFSPKWAVNLEFATISSNGSLGLSCRF